MRIDIAFQAYADDVSRATTVLDVGEALRGLAAALDVEFVLIADTGKISTASAALVYASEPREAQARFANGARFSWRPIIDAVMKAGTPLSFSEIKARLNLTDTAWTALLPRWLAGTHGFATVSSGGEHAWYFEFASGAQPTGVSRSLLHVATDLAARWLEDFVRGSPRHPALTARETEALALIATGKSDAEAAAAMRVTPRTIRFHIDNAKRKFGVATRAQAIVQALRRRAGRSLSSRTTRLG